MVKSNKKFWFSLSLAVLFGISLAIPVSAGSASLYLFPPSGTYTVDSTFSVKVKVNSGGDTINVAEGTLVFNPDEISVVNLSKGGSIFSLWTTEPTFSNSTGNIVFGGGTSSAFTGTSGTIINITFKARASASAQVGFSSGSVLAADGKGTNILGNMQGGLYTLKPKIVTPPAEEVSPEVEYIPEATPGGAPAAPVVSSSTHPNPNKWYSNNDPEFSWKVPTDVTAVKLLIEHLPTAIPAVLYTPPISEKKIEDLEDGVWYFHIRFKNQYGWGGILHRKVLVDTTSPEPFEINVDNGGDPTNPSPIFHFKTTDSPSGVEYYEVKIGESEGEKVLSEDIEAKPYKIPPQAPGKYTVLIKAVDKAGNSTPAIADIAIEPTEAPIITDFPQTVRAGDILIIRGISEYPEAQVTVFVKKAGEEATTKDVQTDSEGNWLFVYDKSLEKGTYQIWAVATDSRGAKSNPTEKITLAATLPTILKFGKIAIDYLNIVITLVILIAVLIAIIFYAWRRISLWQKRIRIETKEVEKSVRRAFGTLREEVQEQIEYLDKKPGLNKGEKKIRDELQKALNISEEFIRKEIKDIKKELK